MWLPGFVPKCGGADAVTAFIDLPRRRVLIHIPSIPVLRQVCGLTLPELSLLLFTVIHVCGDG